MKDYLKKFKAIGDYNLWKNSENCIAPNVSLIEDDQNDIVDYNSLIIINPSLTMNSWVYGETPSTPVLTGNPGNGNVTYMYKVSTDDDSTYTSTQPSEVGTYIIKAIIEAKGFYSAGSCTATFTINKAAGSVSTAPVANSLTYDGTPQTVASAGVGTGTMMYRLGDSGDYSSTMPTATDVGSYTLYYYAAESTNYNATTPAFISIIIQTPSHNYANDYLTIESLEDSNTISFSASDRSLTKTISVSIDNGTTWTDKKSTESGVTLATLNTGDKLLIKGSNTACGNSSYSNSFVSTGEFNVEGNIMSLLYGDNFIEQTTLDSMGYNFKDLFKSCNKLKSAEHLVLPATILTDSCYKRMFYGCKSLSTAPELPATTLATDCYNAMFQGCNSLSTAPELPATTLATGCYSCMFQNCTSLNYIKCLATNISASYWLYNVASTGTFVKNASMTSWTTGESGIPSGWTIQDAV